MPGRTLPSWITAGADQFVALLTQGSHMHFVDIDAEIAQSAAQLRARYNLRLADALQVVIALSAGCDVFLTNDSDLRRIVELPVWVLDELLQQ